MSNMFLRVTSGNKGYEADLRKDKCQDGKPAGIGVQQAGHPTARLNSSSTLFAALVFSQSYITFVVATDLESGRQRFRQFTTAINVIGGHNSFSVEATETKSGSILAIRRLDMDGPYTIYSEDAKYLSSRAQPILLNRALGLC
ncbi:hypothetical protein BG015_000318 [Linnemannia schmuckeri]|uniref:Uncharacterized protein n=1 Tax=Linnemannia schmuckeri TaxID=64567 RepID=A0A9P5RR79_9FUNG|nr:hypothetical protein BG015_000318 [Linnemannia schmuckeri]